MLMNKQNKISKVLLNIRIEDEIRKKAAKKAQLEGSNLSQKIREFLHNYIKQK